MLSPRSLSKSAAELGQAPEGERMSVEQLGLITKHLLWEGQDDSGSRLVISLGYISEPSPIPTLM